eukprot:scaffold28670_cov66-Phaeocystis_antarctica.AAC.2
MAMMAEMKATLVEVRQEVRVSNPAPRLHHAVHAARAAQHQDPRLRQAHESGARAQSRERLGLGLGGRRAQSSARAAASWPGLAPARLPCPRLTAPRF